MERKRVKVLVTHDDQSDFNLFLEDRINYPYHGYACSMQHDGVVYYLELTDIDITKIGISFQTTFSFL